MQRLRYLLAGIFFFSSLVMAAPSLQLDIVSDLTVYDTTTEDVVTADDTFTVYAYGNNNSPRFDIDQDYYISVAITPQGTATGTNFGSFMFGGSTFSSSDLIFGVPPLESFIAADGGDLGSHDVFETLFTEILFSFDGAPLRTDVNVEDTPGTDPLANLGTDISFVGFAVDTSSLLEGFELHFDLYSTDLGNGGADDIDIDRFAPFSHDASSIPGLDIPPPNIIVPEPQILTLFSLGLMLIAGFLRRRRS